MYAAIPAYLLEDVDVGSAIDRSMFLARGNMVHVLGVCVPVVLGLTTCNLAVSALIRLTWGAVTPHVHIPVRVETLSVMVAGLAIRPFAHVSQAVVYYDLRVRREGLDIESMAAALDASSAPADAAPNAPEANPA
ncbi:MAG: hypothetical protein ACREND_15430 [Gemmatimonadaceae bacterium]